MRKRALGAMAVVALLTGVVFAVGSEYHNRHNAPPVVKYHTFFKAPPGANVAIIGTSVQTAGGISPSVDGTAFRVTTALTTASVLNVTATDGTSTGTWGLNSSTALQAGDLYTFVFATDEDLRYDFQVESDGTIEFLGVEEIIAEGQ